MEHFVTSVSSSILAPSVCKRANNVSSEMLPEKISILKHDYMLNNFNISSVIQLYYISS